VSELQKHQSQWFARFNKNKYSQSVLEDRMIRDTLSKLFPELLNPFVNKTQNVMRSHQLLHVSHKLKLNVV
jgi:hypothetical protein